MPHHDTVQRGDRLSDCLFHGSSGWTRAKLDADTRTDFLLGFGLGQGFFLADTAWQKRPPQRCIGKQWSVGRTD